MTGHAYIAARKAADPTNAAEWAEIEALYDDKLWHQLSERLAALPRSKTFGAMSEEDSKKLYTDFVKSFEKKINQLVLVEIVVAVCDRFRDHKEAAAFLNEIVDKVKDDVMALVMCKVHIAELELHQQKFTEAWEILTECAKNVEGIRSLHPRVHGSFYRVSSDFHKAKGNFSEYYTDSLSFLGCVDIATIPNAHQRACDLALAALVGENIYNFGELISHEIFKVLDGTPESWLIDLAKAFNVGNISQFEALKSKWKTVEDLANNERILKQKICLLCLMEIVFMHPDSDRRLSVDAIADKVGLSVSDTEFLVMKALSLDLIKGDIDQVEGMVHITWVKPRVLTRDQLLVVADRVSNWAKKVENLSGKLPVH